MSNSHNTSASHPGNLRLAPEKIQAFRDNMGFLDKLFARLASAPDSVLAQHLQSGDSRAALVLHVQPEVLVAAYSNELDCVAVLHFPQFVRGYYQLESGTRLLTVNSYGEGKAWARDLHRGPQQRNRYSNFYPLIAEFLSNDIADIEARKKQISEPEWERTATSARQTMATPGFRPRNGSPFFSFRPV